MTDAEITALRETMRELGCPYDATDPRAVTFLEGAKAGSRLAFSNIRKALSEASIEERGE